MSRKSQASGNWAPRVPQALIRRLYELDAMGVRDDELVEEVGYGLYARCLSYLEAAAAAEGLLDCPQCGRKIPHQFRGGQTLWCADCGWSSTWSAYREGLSRAHPHIDASVAVQIRQFVRQFPHTRRPRERMLLIDALIHGFHWALKEAKPGPPLAVNLIEGDSASICAFLDALSSGSGSRPSVHAMAAAWREHLREAN